MTVTAGPVQWVLSDRAEAQMTAQGLALTELYRLVVKPEGRTPTWDNPRVHRLTGYGLRAYVEDSTVLAVGLDGATAENWERVAVERAWRNQRDTLEADALVYATATSQDPTKLSYGVPAARTAQVPVVELPALMTKLTAAVAARKDEPEPKPHEKEKKVPASWADSHFLSRIHPALHEEITRQVAGQWDRLVIHSPTRVEIIPT